MKMTEKIKSAIKDLKEIPQHIGEDCDGYELRALRLAINSLNAWDEVLQELEEQKIAFYQNSAFLTSNAIQSVIDFIKQKLSEVE